MLALRPNCECCDKDLPPDAARCPDLLLRMHVLRWTARRTACPAARCPNCGGELVRRPVRPPENLARPSTRLRPSVCQEGSCLLPVVGT